MYIYMYLDWFSFFLYGVIERKRNVYAEVEDIGGFSRRLTGCPISVIPFPLYLVGSPLFSLRFVRRSSKIRMSVLFAVRPISPTMWDFEKYAKWKKRRIECFAFWIINDDRWKMATENSPDVEYHVRVYIILSYRSEQENGRKSRNERKNLLTFRYLHERR